MLSVTILIWSTLTQDHSLKGRALCNVIIWANLGICNNIIKEYNNTLLLKNTDTKVVGAKGWQSYFKGWVSKYGNFQTKRKQTSKGTLNNSHAPTKNQQFKPGIRTNECRDRNLHCGLAQNKY